MFGAQQNPSFDGNHCPLQLLGEYTDHQVGAGLLSNPRTTGITVPVRSLLRRPRLWSADKLVYLDGYPDISVFGIVFWWTQWTPLLTEAHGISQGCGEFDGAIAAAAAGTVPAGCPIPHRTTTLTFTDCAHFARHLAAHPNGLREAKSRWVRKSEWKGELPGEVTVTHTLNEAASVVATPQYTWPKMTLAERTALDAALERLSVHEHGHLTVAREFFAQHSSEDYHARSHKQAQAISDEKGKKLEKALNRREREYDRITHHGFTQSDGPSAGFPGGEDVTFDCRH
jgi:hypothetical protein